MLIDSHAHLPFNEDEAQNIIENAKKENIEKIVTIGTDLSENEQVIEQLSKFEDIYAGIGIYPNAEREKNTTELLAKLDKQLVKHPKIVGVGECGIDITNWEQQRPVQKQIELFRGQIELSIKHNLPIIIHNRNGDTEVLNILKEYRGKVYGIAHCFDTSWEVAEKLLELNFYISFSGFITYNSKKYLLETVKKTPIDRMLVETDSPYIKPKGVKDDKNEPKNVKMVAVKIAEVREIPFEKVCENTYMNTKNIFRIK